MKEKQIIWPDGVKKTRQRKSVLSILEKSDKPLSAAEICSQMEKDGEAAWMSTVYRTLELFVNKDVVVKTNVMNTDMAVYELNHFTHKHYAVCTNCHTIIPMNNCPMDTFTPKLEDEDFKIMGHNLEVFGFCKNCKPSEISNSQT